MQLIRIWLHPLDWGNARAIRGFIRGCPDRGNAVRGVPGSKPSTTLQSAVFALCVGLASVLWDVVVAMALKEEASTTHSKRVYSIVQHIGQNGTSRNFHNRQQISIYPYRTKT